ncbi:hypothetical protein BDF20DRAFT_838379 [Mycotypha africana]|uniref:uncharacterized protein n=1 Tax=Mycotypha africana TaxID=64632 RepID=UPI0023006E7D|nr:uncharacterized protein BDF20DRAFT_838379 [Mycotypha africana]KAI8969964.1 hypothetical protein BDF20DRAFT_838379 [Mycotypha africana]
MLEPFSDGVNNHSTTAVISTATYTSIMTTYQSDSLMLGPTPLLAANKLYNSYLLIVTVGLSVTYGLTICLRLFIHCCRRYHDRLQQQEKRRLRSAWASKIKRMKVQQKIQKQLPSTLCRYPSKTLQPIPFSGQQQRIQLPLSHHSSISSLTLKNTTASSSSFDHAHKPLLRIDFIKDLIHMNSHSSRLEKLEEGEDCEEEEAEGHKSYCSLKLETLRHTNSSSGSQQQYNVMKVPLDSLEIADFSQQDNRSAKADFTRKFSLKNKIHRISKTKKLDLLWQWSISMGYCEYTHAVAMNEMAQQLIQHHRTTAHE